jgi:hypothetical protein
MWTKTLLVSGVLLSLVTGARAQTKISGTLQCDKGDPQNVIPVGDRAGHSFMITQTKCTWRKPLEVEGAKSTDDLSTFFNEITGNRVRQRGFAIASYAGGDKTHTRFQGSGILKEGVLQSTAGTWTTVAGTGKLKGIKAKGTFKGKGNPDGTTVFEVEGEYEMPKPK